jgi:hypothetical protein
MLQQPARQNLAALCSRKLASPLPINGTLERRPNSSSPLAGSCRTIGPKARLDLGRGLPDSGSTASAAHVNLAALLAATSVKGNVGVSSGGAVEDAGRMLRHLKISSSFWPSALCPRLEPALQPRKPCGLLWPGFVPHCPALFRSGSEASKRPYGKGKFLKNQRRRHFQSNWVRSAKSCGVPKFGRLAPNWVRSAKNQKLTIKDHIHTAYGYCIPRSARLRLDSSASLSFKPR